MCAIAGFLYILGTYQGFMDTTQFFLLNITGFFGKLLFITCFFGFLVDLIYLFRKRIKRYFISLIFYIILGIFGGIVSSSAYFIMVLSDGNMSYIGFF